MACSSLPNCHWLAARLRRRVKLLGASVTASRKYPSASCNLFCVPRTLPSPKYAWAKPGWSSIGSQFDGPPQLHLGFFQFSLPRELKAFVRMLLRLGTAWECHRGQPLGIRGQQTKYA